MSQIAERAGIGRATLYKYFPDIEAMLHAWHRRQVERHLNQLHEVRDQPGAPGERLQRVLECYAFIQHARAGHESGGSEGGAADLHGADHVGRAERRLATFLREVVKQAAGAGAIRDDISPDELVRYCLRSLGAARGAASKAAVRRLVAVTLDGLRFNENA